MIKDLYKSIMNLRIASSYGVVGLTTALLYYVIYIALVEIYDFQPFWAAVMGYLPGIPIGYLLCYYWVFDSSKDIYRTSIKYLSVNLAGYVVNFIGIYITVNVFSFPYAISQFCLFFVVALHNYLLNYHWTFIEEDKI